ncbi:hypothetical protein J6590_045184 [Homalodisca vitripennis]|nr:hypothetical protein J6590_045184 [Homalodisca vitripennis]
MEFDQEFELHVNFGVRLAVLINCWPRFEFSALAQPGVTGLILSFSIQLALDRMEYELHVNSGVRLAILIHCWPRFQFPPLAQHRTSIARRDTQYDVGFDSPVKQNKQAEQSGR